MLERHVEELDHVFKLQNHTDSHQIQHDDDDLEGFHEIKADIHELELAQQDNHWNLESLSDQVDRVQEKGQYNDYLRNDMNSLKEQQNLQEIKHLMMSQEMQRIITTQDQKVCVIGTGNIFKIP
jgi:hypothetical protein